MTTTVYGLLLNSTGSYVVLVRPQGDVSLRGCCGPIGDEAPFDAMLRVARAELGVSPVAWRHSGPRS